MNQSVVGSCSSYKSDDTTDDEEGLRDRNRPVEWTKEDEQNVMDLGLSEIERNRRLESLIARRRSRRWLNLQAKKIIQCKASITEMEAESTASQVATILIPRNNPFLPNSSDSATSPTPGSAPSVLLPMRNPFDLPYDPQEEKPNLTGDEFHQEFMAAHQKDIMFCRHESFVRGPFDRPDIDRARLALDRIRTRQAEEYGSGSSPKTFKSKRDSILKSPKLAAWRRMAADRRENYPRNEFLFEAGPSVFGRITMRERRYHPENEPHHNPTNSFASDMQVEVSESSSPPLTVDGDYEAACLGEKKMSVGSEEMWGPSSSHLSDVDKLESNLRGVHEVSESDLMQVGFSKVKPPVNLSSSPPPLPSVVGDNDEMKEVIVHPDETISTNTGSESEVPRSIDVQLFISNEQTDSKDETQNKNQNDREEPPKPSSDENISSSRKDNTEEVAQDSTELTENIVESSVNESTEQAPVTTASNISPKSVLNPTTSISSDVENNRMVEITPGNLPFQSSNSESTPVAGDSQKPEPSEIKTEESPANLLNTNHKDSPSSSRSEGSADRKSAQVNLSRQWWLNVD